MSWGGTHTILTATVFCSGGRTAAPMAPRLSFAVPYGAMRLARSAAPLNREARTFGGRGGSGTSGNVRKDTHLVCKFSSSSSGGKQRVAPSPLPHALTIRRRVRGVNFRIARYVVAGFKSSMRAARGSSLSSIIGYSTPGSSSSKGPSSKYSTWGHVESSTGGSDLRRNQNFTAPSTSTPSTRRLLDGVVVPVHHHSTEPAR